MNGLVINKATHLEHCSGEIHSDCIPQVEHVELDEFLEIIADIQDAGWAVKVVRENEMISDQVAAENIWRRKKSTQSIFLLSCPFWYAQDLKHVFDKVDRNKDEYVNRMVGEKTNNSTTAGLA